MPTLNRILARYADQVRVNVVWDQAFYNALETRFKAFTEFCAYDRFTEILRASDIALIPLKDTRFNRCKSDLKFIECAAQGVVALASPVVYGETILDGRTGLLFNSPQEFETKLNRLIEDRIYRRTVVENAYQYVAESRLLA